MRIGRTSAIHFGSQFAVTIIGFLGTIYFARVLGADVLGTYSLTIAVYLWLELLTTTGIKSAVMKRLSEGDNRGRLLGAAAVMQYTLVCLVIGLLVLFSTPFENYVGVEALEIVILLVIIGSTYRIINNALKGEKKVHIAALLGVVDKGFRVPLQVLFVLAGWTVLGLLVGYLIAMVIAVIIGIYFLSTKLSIPHREDFRSIFSFAKYAWIGGLSGQSFVATDTLVLGLFVSSTLIGIYEVAWNIASILAVFSSSISQAIFPEISSMSEKENNEKAADLINDALAFTGLFTIPGLIGGAILGEWILGIYGTEFRQGAQILTILIVARLISAYQSQILNALSAIDRPDIAFRINIVFLITNIALNLALVYLYGWIGAGVATATSAAVSLLLGYFSLRSQLDIHIPSKEIIKQIFAAAVMGGIIYVMTILVNVDLLTGITFVGIGAAIYFLVLITISLRFRTTVRNNLPTK